VVSVSELADSDIPRLTLLLYELSVVSVLYIVMLCRNVFTFYVLLTLFSLFGLMTAKLKLMLTY